MSSLQSIMNLDEDQQEASGPTDKKDKDQATPAADVRHQEPSTTTSSSQLTRTEQQSTSTSSAPTITIPITEESNVYYPVQQSIDVESSASASARQVKRSAELSSGTPTLLSAASSGQGDLRRQSTASVDSMDQYGYASSSSMGGGSGGGFPPNHPRRPMGASPVPDAPVRYTPITGRVSRAKKGVPVHICESCNPPKTFTRAEHLRRHQLSHQQPRFPCDQCDRAFHRQDLLTRHQQRHNQEGGGQGSPLDDGGRRDSDASGGSGGPGLHPPYSSASRILGGASTPSSASEIPSGTPPAGSRSASMGMSPQPRDGSDAYGTSSDQPNYRIDMPNLVQHDRSMDSSPSAPVFSHVDYDMIPRTVPLFVATEGLPLHASLDPPPELVQSNDYSPWTSASESTYSTPGDQPPRRTQWRHAPQPSLEWQNDPDFLSAFPSAARRSVSTTEGFESMATTQYYTFPTSPHMTPVSHNSYDPLLSGSIMPTFASEQNRSLMNPRVTGHHAISHARSSSVRSQTPELSIPTSGQVADTLVMPAPLPNRIDSIDHARRKELSVVDKFQDRQMEVLAGNSHWNDDNPSDSAILTGVPIDNGCGNGAVMMAPLPRSVRNAIPTYIEIYWARFHQSCPVVHRRTFEGQGEDALRCAMAAIGTQFLAGKDDRIKGAQLHDFAWQEAKRLPQSSLQVMQSILLCEFFARFRGRKAVVRPSKHFEHLYLRVSDSMSLQSSASGDDNSPYVPVSYTGSFSSLPSLFSCSTGLQSQSLSNWSPQTTELESVLSPNQDFPRYGNINSGPTPLLFSPGYSFSPEQISSPSVSSIYSSQPQASHDVSMNNDLISFPSSNQGQLYSDSFSSQVLHQGPDLYDTALPSNDANFGHQLQERWRSWIETEGRRRLLAACFIVDNHASTMHQQPCAKDNVDPSILPMTDHSNALWFASSAEQWFTILHSDNTAGQARFLPRLDNLRPEEVAEYSVFDRIVVLNAAALGLSRSSKQFFADKSNVQISAAIDDLRTPTTASYAAQAIKGSKTEEQLLNLFSLDSSPMAHVYMALHHTPLHALLAISGESWVFSQKLLVAPTYHDHQKLLKAWVNGRCTASPTSSASPISPTTAMNIDGMSSAKATFHAAHALIGYLKRGAEPANGVTPYITCLSDYWAMYVCALIIWAIGLKAGKPASAGSSDSPIARSRQMSEDEAVAWLRAVTDTGVPEQASRVKGRRDASAAIVSMVKRRLEADCVGGRNRLYVDAVGVLKKLEEGVNSRWF